MRFRATTLAALAAAAALATAAPPAGAAPKVAFGAFTPGAPENRSSIDAFTRKAGRAPSLWMTYRNWTESPVPVDMLRNVDAADAVASVTWEPWSANLRAISGGSHDAYIRRSAREAAEWGKPVLLRFAHEMNGDWVPWGLGVNGNKAGDYIAAWRHVVNLFRDEGAKNVRWVWSPNVGKFDSLYPGDRWVDWLALDGYNWGAKYDAWESFDQIYADSYRAITRLSKKPVMVGEFASNEQGGNKAAWIRQTFSRENLERYSRIKAYIWFDINKETDWRIDSSGATLSAFRSAIGSPMLGLDAPGLLAMGDSEDPAPPADPPPATGDDIADAGRLRCYLRGPSTLRMNSVWDVTVPVRCGRRPAVRCMGVVKLKHIGTGRTLGTAQVELWAGRTRPVRIGLPGWARTSLRFATRVGARMSFRTDAGCRPSAARRVTLAR